MEDDWENKFVTTVGLITSNGPHGNDIMAAEWTHQISYNPPLIAIHVNTKHATYDNINFSNEFGVNLCSENQNILSNVSGGSSGKNVNKIKVLEELDFNFYKADKINVLMVKGCAMNAECRLINKIVLGDHVMFIGEVVSTKSHDINPIVLSNGKYWKLNNNIKKPSEKILKKIQNLINKNKK